MEMEFMTFRQEHVEQATTLVHQAYERERAAVPLLPTVKSDILTSEIEQLCTEGLGFAVVQDGTLAGFLAGMRVQRFFGAADGVYIPIYGHGAQAEQRVSLQWALYAHAAQNWVDQGLTSHAITMFTHDGALVQAWFHMGFGLRCVDAIRPPAPVEAPDSGLTVRLLTPDDADAILPLHREHQSYYHRSPLFMPYRVDATAEWMRQWLEQPCHHIWAAFDEGQPVSYMQVKHGGETFVSDDAAMRNICGAFTAPAARGRGAATVLLRHICAWMAEQGFTRLGVDFESFNPLGSAFWLRHFTPFTYSLTRRVDERIIGFSPYD